MRHDPDDPPPKASPTDWYFHYLNRWCEECARWLRALGFLALPLFLALLITPLSAHDIYMGIKRPDDPTTSCCGDASIGGDCRPVAYKYEGGRWFAIEGKRVTPIPKQKETFSPDGRAHLCESAGTIYCFMKPEGES